MQHIVNPVLLGGGTRLFDGPYPRTELRLTGSRQFTSGALLLTYEPVSGQRQGRGLAS